MVIDDKDKERMVLRERDTEETKRQVKDRTYRPYYEECEDDRGDMRDVKRIKRILGYIEKYWNKNPDMRFYQMLINLGVISKDDRLWNMEDDKTEKTLQNLVK